jgi:hypothetical protein
MFNAFNAVVYNGRSTTIQFNSPTDLTIRNPQYVLNPGDTTLAPGVVPTTLNSGVPGTSNTGRLLTTNAGFGAVTGAQAMRSLQLNARFAF